MSDSIELLPEAAPSSPPDTPPALSTPKNWLFLWKELLLHPNEETYVRLAANSSLKQAFFGLWIVSIFGLTINQLTSSFDSFTADKISITIRFLPVMATAMLLYHTLNTAFIQWFARRLKGEGNFTSLMYLYSNISMPFLLINTMLNLLPLKILHTGSLYSFYLYLLATKSINRFGWGKTIVAVVVPSLILLAVLIAIGIAVFLYFFAKSYSGAI